ncbi:hypothetical protein [Candidatus Methylacidithermus pantelleriae]|uniref:Uncharacterized protein n=1 Tax=Candidatus Methylacidithermus pantelleriae TaxID=2744239 RepID=A0A8J2BR48_9BACT|nr:hypothetical protein [Candidatus Methylacidithermus pantelleriae]CAF0692484.1 hypothetical protein MPNT_120033 [Candidatus Methylacidithermus pantelleriae]
MRERWEGAWEKLARWVSQAPVERHDQPSVLPPETLRQILAQWHRERAKRWEQQSALWGGWILVGALAAVLAFAFLWQGEDISQLDPNWEDVDWENLVEPTTGATLPEASFGTSEKERHTWVFLKKSYLLSRASPVGMPEGKTNEALESS